MIRSIEIIGNDKLTNSPRFGLTLIGGKGEFGGYSHQKRALGGDWSASFDVFTDEETLQSIFESALLSNVKVWGEGGQPAWMGLITGMTLTTPTGEIRKDVNEISNSVFVRYQTTSGTGADIANTVQEYDAEGLARMQADMGGGSIATRGTVYTNQLSIDRYSQIDHTLSAGTVSLALANQIAQTFLANKAFPSSKPENISLGGNGGNKAIGLRITCSGTIQTLNWRIYNDATGGVENATTAAARIISTVGFFVDTFRFPVANTTQVPATRDSDRKALDQLFDLARVGDSSFNRWITYARDNIVYFEQAQSSAIADLRYTIKTTDDRTEIFDKTQSSIQKEFIEPNEYIRVEALADFKALATNLDKDDAVAYIESVTYRDPDTLDIVGSRGKMFDVALKRLSLGNNSTI